MRGGSVGADVFRPPVGHLPPPLAGEGRGGGYLDHFLVADALSARSVDLVEADVLAPCRRVEADGNAHQPETYRAGPDGPRHSVIMLRRAGLAPSGNLEWARGGGWPRAPQ